MTYVVTDNCIMCKYTDCVDVCPVDCFYEGENMLVIDPEVCIDCAACVPECPAGAIFPESEELVDWISFNKQYSEEWRDDVITKRKPPMEDAEKYDGMEGKLEKFFKGK